MMPPVTVVQHAYSAAHLYGRWASITPTERRWMRGVLEFVATQLDRLSLADQPATLLFDGDLTPPFMAAMAPVVSQRRCLECTSGKCVSRREKIVRTLYVPHRLSTEPAGTGRTVNTVPPGAPRYTASPLKD